MGQGAQVREKSSGLFSLIGEFFFNIFFKIILGKRRKEGREDRRNEGKERKKEEIEKKKKSSNMIPLLFLWLEWSLM